jgi:hypothetical protein
MKCNEFDLNLNLQQTYYSYDNIIDTTSWHQCCLDIIESTIAMNDKLQTSSTHNNCQEWLDAHHCLEGEVVRLEDEMEGLKKEVSARKNYSLTNNAAEDNFIIVAIAIIMPSSCRRCRFLNTLVLMELW